MSSGNSSIRSTVDSPAINRRAHWLSRISLRRITASTKFIPQIDGIRFIAILTVMVDHTFYQGMPLLGEGQLLYIVDQRAIGFRAVYLFFSLSGFILALPFARHYLHEGPAVDIKAYFKRRLTRLEPPFIVSLITRLIIFLIFSATPAVILFKHFLASIFYLHSAIYGPGSSISRPAWSFEIEVQFYIVAPLLAILFRIRPTWLRRTILIALIAGFSIAAGIPALLYNDKLTFSLLFNLQYFLSGFLVCDLYVLRDRNRSRSILWDIAGILALMFYLHVAHSFELLTPFVNAIIILAAFYGRLSSRFYSLSFVSIIGGMCYSIYLTHNSIVTIVHKVLVRIPALTANHPAFDLALLLVSLVSMLIVGAIFFVLIERPCMDPAWPSKVKAWFSGKRARPVHTA